MAVCVFTAGLCLAQVKDLNGTWQLNVEKSKWGKHPKPTSGTITIEHHDPALKYSGMVATRKGGELDEDKSAFTFDGAIDGKDYPTSGTTGPAKIAYKRVNASTITSELKSNDGKVMETATTSISRDGKTLTRELKANAPSGEMSWTEVYDRK